jgi:hypothetical protein
MNVYIYVRVFIYLFIYACLSTYVMYVSPLYFYVL